MIQPDSGGRMHGSTRIVWLCVYILLLLTWYDNITPYNFINYILCTQIHITTPYNINGGNEKYVKIQPNQDYNKKDINWIIKMVYITNEQPSEIQCMEIINN